MGNLARTARRRVASVLAVGMLLTGGAGASVLLGAGPAQATACPGTPVAAGTTCTDTGTLTFTAGSLTLTSPTALAWTAVDTGADQQVADTTTAQETYLVNDATGSGAGWNVTATATAFSTSGSVALGGTGLSTTGSVTSQVSTTAPTAACSASTTCTLPTDTSVTYPLLIATTATKIYDALVNTGLGSIVIGGSTAANPVGWWVNIPANAKPGTYLSTITLGVVSAP
jgi:putative surface cell wall-binding protein